MNTKNIEACIDACNSLLRGEISAIETYSHAVHEFGDANEVSLLENMRRDHIESATWLREHVREMGGEPSRDSGLWGAWARGVEGAAKLIGEKTALKALQEGEEHGEKEYEDALEKDRVLDSCKEVIRSELLPRQRQHVSTLRGMAKAR
jgi:uncharacterized protein (TIGR02284 family)